MTTLEELLEQRDIVTEIAIELYGPMYIFNRKFWGSTTEQEINDIQHRLMNLGYEFEPTPEEKELADIIYKALLEQEIIKKPKDENDEKGPQHPSDI